MRGDVCVGKRAKEGIPSSYLKTEATGCARVANMVMEVMSGEVGEEKIEMDFMYLDLHRSAPLGQKWD